MRFIDYLSHKRLMKASELLTKTKLSIRDIVEQIGYIDVSSFTRKFTAEYGQSPGRFRQNALRTT
jgi:transcriptional regulator GlxA family with amidase domain